VSVVSRSTLRGRPGIRATHVELDLPLADAVAAWLAAQWPWERVHRTGR
jgi:hypothetical protein